jgi:Hsp70 protein
MARRQAILNPKGTIYSAKRFIGRKYQEVTSEINAVSFDVVPGPDDAARFEELPDGPAVVSVVAPARAEAANDWRRSRCAGPGSWYCARSPWS